MSKGRKVGVWGGMNEKKESERKEYWLTYATGFSNMLWQIKFQPWFFEIHLLCVRTQMALIIVRARTHWRTENTKMDRG